MSVCRMCVCVCVRVAEVGYEAMGEGVCILKGLVQCVRGPFRLPLLRQSFGEGAHSNRTWLLRGGESSSTPDPLACRRRLSQPPSPLLGLADTLHRNQHHPRGRPYLTLSRHVRSCRSTHANGAPENNLFTERVGRRLQKSLTKLVLTVNTRNKNHT